MKTWESREAAIADRQEGAVCVIEIEHATQGRVYIQGRAPMASLAAALNRKPMLDIIRLVSEYSFPATPEVAENHCDRCGVTVPKTAYNQQEWTRFGSQRVRVTAYYCIDCARVMHAVGAGEHSDIQDRAANVPSYEPTTKED